MKALKNEKGLTLIEVLAALVILGIIFTGFMTIFPQMTLFNQKTEAKLDTMNLAREEMENIVSTADRDVWEGKKDGSPDIYEEFEDKVPVVLGARGYALDSSNTNSSFLRYQRTSDYRFQADIYLACEPLATGTPCKNPLFTQLYKVHLKVYNGSTLSSETYSYIKFYVED